MLDSYARLSWNPNTAELEKIEDQLADNTKVIERLGGTLGEALSDGLPAWKRTVRRKGMRSDSPDSTRSNRRSQRLIELGEQGFVIAFAHGTRNLASADDRFILRIEVAQPAKSSDDKSRRVSDGFRRCAPSGRRRAVRVRSGSLGTWCSRKPSGAGWTSPAAPASGAE